MSPGESIPESAKIERRLEHPCFPQPARSEVSVWRYMDLSKLISLLDSQSLYLSRLDMLSDPYEGTLTAKTIEGISEFLKRHGAKVGWEGMSEHYKENQRTTFVNCWYANEHESEAMWRLYCGQAHGAAVRTTYQQLIESIKEQRDVYLGLVRYIDYEKEWFPNANAFYPVMHKRLTFAHENEVRLVSSPSKFRGSNPEPATNGLNLPWNPCEFIEAVYVDPYAPEYFFEAVKAVVRELAPYLEGKLVWSQMKAAPLF